MSESFTVDQLRGMVGQQVGTSRWFPITQTMIDAHADIVDDHQFIHIDPVRAAEYPVRHHHRARVPDPGDAVGDGL